MKKICLVSIVKNESRVIIRMLNSVKHLIDHFIIVDTGSTDNTIELIKTWSETTGIKGEIFCRSWVNFAYNRTEALQLAKDKGDYVILMDADEIVEDDNFNKNKLNADGYYIHYTGDCDYAQILLINNRINWKYKSVTHEYIYSDEAKIYLDIKELKMTHFYDGGNRAKKFERDIELLKQGIIDEPNNSRYYFYLGQSHKDLNKFEEAIQYYAQAIKLSEWVEEVFYSKYAIGHCYEKLGKLNEAKIAYLKAWESRPNRAEPLYKLAVLCRNNKEYNLAYLFCKRAEEICYPTDHLFIEKPVYEYMILFEKSISAYYIGKVQEAYNVCKILLNDDRVSEEIQRQTRYNIQFSEIKLFGKVITTSFDRKRAFENLKDIYKICNKLDIPIFPFAGTLLGIVRENDFIGHDEDMDFGIRFKDYKPNLVNALISNGFKFELSIGKLEKGLELRFSKRHIQVDIFIFYDKLDYQCTYCYDNNGNLYELKFNAFQLEERIFKTTRILVPTNVEDFIRQQYGNDWKTPKKVWNYLTDNQNQTKEKK